MKYKGTTFECTLLEVTNIPLSIPTGSMSASLNKLKISLSLHTDLITKNCLNVIQINYINILREPLYTCT
jgi:hypothetical protein